MNTTTSTAPFNPATTDDKTTAIVSYLTQIGFVAAVIMHGSKKSKLGSFHLRQSLGLMLTSIAVAFGATILAFVPVLGWMIGLAAWFALLAFWVMCLLSAINGVQKPVSVVGQHFQKWFGSAFD